MRFWRAIRRGRWPRRNRSAVQDPGRVTSQMATPCRDVGQKQGPQRPGLDWICQMTTLQYPVSNGGDIQESGACHMNSYRHETTGRNELARRACRDTTSVDSPDSGPPPEVWRASRASDPDTLPPGREPRIGAATYEIGNVAFHRSGPRERDSVGTRHPAPATGRARLDIQVSAGMGGAPRLRQAPDNRITCRLAQLSLLGGT